MYYIYILYVYIYTLYIYYIYICIYIESVSELKFLFIFDDFFFNGSFSKFSSVSGARHTGQNPCYNTQRDNKYKMYNM